MSEWQPISTAPKDKPVLLYGEPSMTALGWWDGSDKNYPWRFVAPGDVECFVTVDEDGNELVSSGSWAPDGPSHWMPLPEPPK